MPDTALPIRRTADARTVADLIRAERQPLPAHSLEGVNYRAWALAVCSAEVRHRGNDFARCERLLGLDFDRFAHPTCEQIGQFPHEARAAVVLHWLSHLQTHESFARWPNGPRDGIRGMKRGNAFGQRDWWLSYRRKLWSGFVQAVEAYKEARALIDRPVMKAVA